MMKNNDNFVEKQKYENDVWDDDNDMKNELKKADELYFVFNVFHHVHELSCFQIPKTHHIYLKINYLYLSYPFITFIFHSIHHLPFIFYYP